MKIVKNFTFGIFCLFGFTVLAVEPNVPAEKTVEVKEKEDTPCSLVFNECNRLYPDNHLRFTECMEKGGC